MKSLALLKNVLYILGFAATIISLLLSRVSDLQKNMEKEKRRSKSKFFAYFKAIVATYKFPIIVVVLSILIIFSIDVFTIINTPEVNSISNIKTTPNVNAPTPLKVGVGGFWLDEIDPILPNTNAVVRSKWNPTTDISVSGVSYQHGIGFYIPAEIQNAYFINQGSEQIIHSEFIEYSLNFKYQTLRFEYGVDDSSFTDEDLYPPQCQFWIVVQSCSSDAYLMQDDNILFQSAPANYRLSLQTSGNIDVTNVETVRITVYWKFEVSQTNPISLHIALVDPVLYPLEN